MKEEVGVDVTDIHYVGSQNWPFPSQLMIGFVATYAGGEITIDQDELEDARWFPRTRSPTAPPATASPASSWTRTRGAARPRVPLTSLSQEITPMSITRLSVGPRIAGAVVHGDTVYLAGQVAADASAGVKGQTEQILKKFDELLAAGGSSKAKLLSVTVWLANMGSYDEMNAAWDAWVDPNGKPARATVESRLANPKYLVEIAGIAAR